MTNDIFLSPHFKLSEFVVSETASRHGIDNTPPEEAVENLRRLCQGTLEPLREALQLPVVITSGFRTKALNDKLAHSSERSQHMQGCAADFYVSSAGSIVQGSSTSEATKSSAKGQDPGSKVQGSKFKVQGEEVPSRRGLLIRAFREILTNPKIDYDQLILYPNFIHVSYVSKERNRHNILKARSDGKLGYGRLTRADALKIE